MQPSQQAIRHQKNSLLTLSLSLGPTLLRFIPHTLPHFLQPIHHPLHPHFLHRLDRRPPRLLPHLVMKRPQLARELSGRHLLPRLPLHAGACGQEDGTGLEVGAVGGVEGEVGVRVVGAAGDVDAHVCEKILGEGVWWFVLVFWKEEGWIGVMGMEFGKLGERDGDGR